MNYLVCGYLAQHYISLIQIIAIINSCNINLTLIYINSILKVRLFDVIMMSATVNFFVIAHNADISIHALAKSATFTSQSSNASILYFNPRTREECDRNILLVIAEIIFKIHYLFFNPYIRIKQNISIFT